MVATQKMGPSQAPVCEAFIMTGETILKTYTNKSENSKLKKTVEAADSTTPGLSASTPPPPPSSGPLQTHTALSAPPITRPRTSIANATTKTPTNEATANKIECPNNNNVGEFEAKDYIKHAQYRVAAALEQRAKSVSLGRLNEANYQHHRLAHNDGGLIAWPSKRAAGGVGRVGGVEVTGGGDTNRGESLREEAGARVRFPVHERQQQGQEREREQELRQQKHLHEHVDRLENSGQHERGPLEPTDQERATKELKDCEYSISKQVDLVNKQHETQQQQQQQQQRQKLQPQPQQQPQHFHQMDQRTPAPVTRTATFIVTPRQQKHQQSLRQDQSKLNGGQRFDDDDFSIQFKTGFLNRKRTFEARGKPTSKGHRGWRRVYVILRDLRFIVRYGHAESELEQSRDDAGADQENKEQEGGGDVSESGLSTVVQKMEEQSAKTRKRLAAKDLKNTIRLHHSFAKRSTTYTKREYVFHLYLADQSELLLQASSESEMNAWIDTINFASACLSSPPLPSAVSSSSKRYHHHQHHQRLRPILPASYTKLSYWEQLTDHEERLERLKAELEEHLNEAPVKRHANKRSKSEFIDKIAYLRQKIEHYTVYLDLMQKKSNSPEAIVLSKHPQIASLTPSKEMVRSLPLIAKGHEEEDKKDN